MRPGPFFPYFGSKWQGAKHFGAPVLDLVIEPFAGSACYATRWNCPNVKLYDKYDAICAIWDFLIKCSIDDILNIPDNFEGKEEILRLTGGARALVPFWVGYGATASDQMSLSTYHRYKGVDCSVWGWHVKQRIIKQKPTIANWTIDCMSYEDIPNQYAHWHIDPPYKKTGNRYVHGASGIDYDHLGDWCLSRQGYVQVAENEGADWLPFGDNYEIISAARTKKKSQEVIFTQDNR